jgi:hypothetical protein
MYSFRTLALASLATLAVAAPAAALEPLGSQFRVSDADPQYGADFADIAYDPERGRYLTVWQADKAGEDEIWGRLIAADGTPLGAEFRISDMGPEGDAAFGARAPAVTYNPDEDEYLVVWHGDDDTGLLVADEFEIFAQRLSADGAEVGKNDMRVSEMGPDGNVAYWGRSPDVSYASRTNRYLVVWSATDSSVYVAPKELEIYGQALDADGTEIGPDDQRLSEAGVEGDPDHDADYPAVAYSPQQDEHLVVWNGDLKDGSVEIIGQRVTSGGLPTGVGDVRISDMGPENDSSYTGTRPDVAHNPRRDEYLVVWEGDDDGPLLVDDEREIFAQRPPALERGAGRRRELPRGRGERRLRLPVRRVRARLGAGGRHASAGGGRVRDLRTPPWQRRGPARPGGPHLPHGPRRKQAIRRGPAGHRRGSGRSGVSCCVACR